MRGRHLVKDIPIHGHASTGVITVNAHHLIADIDTKEDYQKFTVMLENDDPINFYKSNKTGRWWMEINLIQHNKYKRRALIPCTYQDYIETTNQMIPDRWFKAQSKMI